MVDSSFYGDTPNYATDYPTQNDSNTNPVAGNTAAPSSFYPNGGIYEELANSDDVLAAAANSAASAAASATGAASSATASAASAAAAAASASTAGTTFLQKANNLSDLSNVATAKANLALVKADVGLGNVDNTSDVNKPVSTAQATADALVASNAAAATALKANIASPALTGTPSAPTAAALNNSTQIATTAYVDAADGVEKARALAAEALKAPLASPALTGVPVAPTAAVNTNSTQLATTAYVLAQAASATPIIDGTATVGTATKFAREDHVHPTDTSRAPSTVTQAGIGAVARTVQDKSRDFISVMDFSGVDATGVSDSTTGIAAAIAATPSGGTLYFPPGTYLVSGSGTAIFAVTTPINILGAGSSISGGTGSLIKLATGVPSTRDVFHITGVTNSVLRGYSFKNFSVSIVSGAGGKNIFHFDTAAGTTTGFAEVIIENVSHDGQASAGGNSILVNNGVGTNTNGGTFNFTVQKCFIGGGIQFVYAGDTLRVLDNIITGANAGVLCNQIAGAGQLLVVGNNITSTGGAVIVNQGVGPVIAFNEIECGATTEANGALVDIAGALAPISSAKIIDNQIQGISATPNCIRIGSATGAFIDGNRLSTAGTCIVNAAAASGTLIGIGNEFPAGTRLTDAGAGTIDPTGAWVAYTSTFAATTGTATVAAKKKVVGKTVFVNISITLTSAVTGTLSVTLPTNSASNAVISGKEIAALGTGAAGFVIAGSSALSVLSAAGAQYTANGNVIVLTGSYEAS